MKNRKIYFIKLLCFLFGASGMFIACSLKSEHECRFWGVIFSEKTPTIVSIISNHLDSLCKLGAFNPDGWGMGYYIESATDTLLPVIRRGEPAAPTDPRYILDKLELLRNVKNSAIAHVRKRSSGPIVGIPDPHPFRRRCINRKFDMLFAHNGTISVDVLLKLITDINSSYLDQNPPDYIPNYLDSDLYSILLVEVMDEYPDLPVEECIKLAVTKLDSALGLSKGQLNFVMASGTSLWGLNFTRDAPRAITLYYYPNSVISDFWIVASQPLDTLNAEWIEIPNRTLACFNPGEPVRYIPISEHGDWVSSHFRKEDLIQPNPFLTSANIKYTVTRPGIVKINIYDGTGRFIKNLLNEFKMCGEYEAFWDGCDAEKNHLPSGSYFCHIQNEESLKVLKVILLR
ncbi:MAG: class II glutamine amidotransferase [candidate division WOR-3 bacterium]